MPDQFDPVAILRTLQRNGVEFIVIGGFAATAYGSPIPTVDIDIMPEPTLENLERLSSALTELGARIRVEGIPGGLLFDHTGRSLQAIDILNLVTPSGALDLVRRPAGSPNYRDLLDRALSIELEGVAVELASLDDVIALKTAADSPKDRSAVPILQALRRRLAEDSETLE